MKMKLLCSSLINSFIKQVSNFMNMTNKTEVATIFNEKYGLIHCNPNAIKRYYFDFIENIYNIHEKLTSTELSLNNK